MLKPGSHACWEYAVTLGSSWALGFGLRYLIVHRIGITTSFELPHRYWEMNLGPLQMFLAAINQVQPQPQLLCRCCKSGPHMIL